MLDSSVLIDVEREVASDIAGLLARLPTPGYVSAVTVGELWVGVFRSDTEQRRERREGFLRRVMDACPLLPFSALEAREFGRLFAELRASGQLIGERDLQIAATALANGQELMTRNAREFARVPGAAGPRALGRPQASSGPRTWKCRCFDSW